MDILFSASSARGLQSQYAIISGRYPTVESLQTLNEKECTRKMSLEPLCYLTDCHQCNALKSACNSKIGQNILWDA